MNAKRVNAAAGVVHAAMQSRQTAAGIAAALESACLLQSPETAAEQRRAVIAERDAQVVAWLVKKAAECGSSNRDSRTAAEAVGRMADKLSRGAVRDDETGVSEMYRLRSENNQLLARVAEVSGARDAWHDWADALAYKVAPAEVLGRHGEEGKFPWDDALKLITPAAEVAALRARVAELESERHSTNEALSKAVERVAELEAAAAKVAGFCAQRAEYVNNLRNCNPDNGHDYDRWQGHAAARRQLSQLLGLPVGWPVEDTVKPHPTEGELAEQRHLMDPLDHALEALAPRTTPTAGSAL